MQPSTKTCRFADLDFGDRCRTVPGWRDMTNAERKAVLAAVGNEERGPWNPFDYSAIFNILDAVGLDGNHSAYERFEQCSTSTNNT